MVQPNVTCEPCSDPKLKNILGTTGEIWICLTILQNNSLSAGFLRCSDAAVVVKENVLILERCMLSCLWVKYHDVTSLLLGCLTEENCMHMWRERIKQVWQDIWLIWKVGYTHWGRNYFMEILFTDYYIIIQ